MDTLDALLSRSSTSALVAPAPEGDELDRILQTALRAPDHGRLRPWRFLVIRDVARQRLADVVAASVVRRDPDAPDAFVEKQRGKFLRPPLVLAVGAKIVESSKAPEVEQLLSVGAATMNVLNALHASGYGAVWITGATSYDPEVGSALGFAAPDRLLGFLLVGTPSAGADRPQPVRPTLADHVAEWPAA